MKRATRLIRDSYDLIVVGGGLAGVCASITAARGGNRVALVQDRPVLGGNASSEVRLWALGASSHMGNNNRWSREGGVIDELLCENRYRNPEGNPVLLDQVLLDKVRSEKNISLFLNTLMHDCELDGPKIRSIQALNPINETRYELMAPLFCDASGDGILAYLSGAEYLFGRSDDDKDLLQYPESFGELLGHSIFFYTKKLQQPVRYIAPENSLKDIGKLKRLHHVDVESTGCNYWWIEWGGQYDTIHESEMIKFELWRIIYGVWDYIKNSGNYPEAENLTLEWVGLIPGKRESRRIIGDYLLCQEDLVRQRRHFDAVSFGGWSLDHHPAAGAYSEEYAPCYQWHTKGVYQIPYRTMYSKNVPNLFTAGRLISTTRAAFGSTRVMLTCASNAQAVGAASVLCKRNGLLPRDIAQTERIGELQQYLLRGGQFIPDVPSHDPAVDKSLQAELSVSSTYIFEGFQGSEDWLPLNYSAALLVPLETGRLPEFSFTVVASQTSALTVELRTASKAGNYTPEITLESFHFALKEGQQELYCQPMATLGEAQYVFFSLQENPHVSVQLSEGLLPGILTLHNCYNKKVARSASQNPPPDIGVDAFEFWTPARRPAQEAKNLALRFSSCAAVYKKEYLQNGYRRPFIRSNLWVAAITDLKPSLTLHWDNAKKLTALLLFFDVDYDFALESVQMRHHDRIAPLCVRKYKVFALLNGQKNLVHECHNNYQGRNQVPCAVTTDTLIIEFEPPPHMPVAIFGLECF